MVADFKEVLQVQCTDELTGLYMYTWAKYDLAHSIVDPIETSNGFHLSLGEACKIIDDFVSDSLFERKLYLKAFLETGKLCHIEEY